MTSRYVSIIHLLSRHPGETAPSAHHDFVVDELAVIIERLGASGNVELLFLSRIEILDLFGYPAVLHFVIWSFKETHIVDFCMQRQIADQSHIRTFRGLDWADPPIMRVVDIAHLQLGTLLGEPAWPQRGQSALMGQLGQRINLIHKLRELAAAKEAVYSSRDRLDANHRCRHHLLGFLAGHSLAGHTFHPEKAGTQLCLKLLTHRPHTLVLQVVNVVNFALVSSQSDDVLQDSQQVFSRQMMDVLVHFRTDLLIDLVPSDSTKVISLGIKEIGTNKRFSTFDGSRIAGVHLTVYIQQTFFGRVSVVVLECLVDLVRHREYAHSLAPYRLQPLGDTFADVLILADNNVVTAISDLVKRVISVVSLQPRHPGLFALHEAVDQLTNSHPVMFSKVLQYFSVRSRAGQIRVFGVFKPVQCPQQSSYSKFAGLSGLDAY